MASGKQPCKNPPVILENSFWPQTILRTEALPKALLILLYQSLFFSDSIYLKGHTDLYGKYGLFFIIEQILIQH